MGKFRSEMFGHLVYDDSLTYEELMECEQRITSGLSPLLASLGASHVHFEPLGDALFIQCVFAEQEAENFEHLCQSLCELSGSSIEGRVLFVGKELDGLWCFFIHNGLCQTAELYLPSPRLGIARRSPRMRYKRHKRHASEHSTVSQALHDKTQPNHAPAE